MSDDNSPRTGASTATENEDQSRHGGWAATAVVIVLGVFYAYYLFDAIRSLVVLPGQYEALGLSRADAPWALLVLGVLVPVVVFVAALVMGRRHTLVGRGLILIAGLGVVACLSLGIIALA
jgi:hypothetical protein